MHLQSAISVSHVGLTGCNKYVKLKTVLISLKTKYAVHSFVLGGDWAVTGLCVDTAHVLHSISPFITCYMLAYVKRRLLHRYLVHMQICKISYAKLSVFLPESWMRAVRLSKIHAVTHKKRQLDPTKCPLAQKYYVIIIIMIYLQIYWILAYYFKSVV